MKITFIYTSAKPPLELYEQPVNLGDDECSWLAKACENWIQCDR